MTSSGTSSSSVPSAGKAPGSALKQKKSLDWLAKGFKRRPAASRSNSDSNSSSKPLGRPARVHGSGNPETLLTIPGSPGQAYSPPSSVDARSCDEEASSTGPSTSGPLTPTSADSTSQQSRKNSSPLSSPLPSPALIPYHGLLDNKPRPLNDDAKTPVIGSEGASAGFTHAERKPPSDYENMLLSLSSRKQLRAMLDEYAMKCC